MPEQTNKVSVSSEVGHLRRVLIHRPDEGISRISPKRAEELLFDDIVYLPRMQEEHDIFTDVLRMFLGAENVLEVGDLLIEALAVSAERREEFIDLLVNFEELPARDREVLRTLSDAELADTLITGYCKAVDGILFDPIPNFIFTRDIAITVNEHIIVARAEKEARFRENLLTRFIINTHSIFEATRQANKIINLNNIDEFPPSRKGEYVSVEGGDVMMIHPDYLLVGCSERTSAHGIELLRERLFAEKVVENVVQINITSARSWMHIDTLFTQVHHSHFVVFKPIVLDGISASVEVFGADGSNRHYGSVKEFLLAEINPDIEFVLSGNGVSPYAEREQWTDGCNLVALKPGVAITYERNERTAEAFRDKGYRIIGARELLHAYKNGIIQPEKIENTIITLPSGELSRARGGSHCMTCPIERA